MPDESLPPRPASLRDLYSHPHTDWSFNTPSSPGSSANGASSSSAWSSRAPPPKHRVLELSPYPFDELEGAGEYILDTRGMIKVLIGNALLQYATTGIAMPFEVAKILMQCQWVPRELTQDEPEEVVIEAPEELEQDSMSESSAESYFHDPAREAFATNRFQDQSTQQSGATNEQGLSTPDDVSRPAYVIPVGPIDGVWSMIKRIKEWRHEGWLALWKAQLTSTVIEAITPQLQAAIQSLLTSIFAPNTLLMVYPTPPSQTPTSHLMISVTSHAIAGFILSPLDLVRTRLIVQTSHALHRPYSGPISVLRSVINDEGGVSSMYLHSNLLIPAVLDNTIRPFLSLATPIFIYRTFGIAEDTHPTTYAFAQLFFASASLLVTLPIETIRRRMQVQTRNGAPPLRACVQLRPTPYSSVVDTCWKILTEERSTFVSTRRTSRKRSRSFKGKERAEDVAVKEINEDSWFASSGIAQFYRGFYMGLTANAVFILANIGGVTGEDPGSGWTEL